MDSILDISGIVSDPESQIHTPNASRPGDSTNVNLNFQSLNPPIDIQTEFCICCSIPRQTFLNPNADWCYEAVVDASGTLVGIQSVDSTLTQEPVALEAFAAALADSSASIVDHVQGSKLFTYSFPVPHHDALDESGNPVRRAYATFLDENRRPIRAVDPQGTVLVCEDPIQAGKVLSPRDPAGITDVPLVVALTPQMRLVEGSTHDPSKLLDVTSDTLKHKVVFTLGPTTNTDIRLLHCDYIDALPVLPLDNRGRPFSLNVDNQLVFPPTQLLISHGTDLTPMPGNEIHQVLDVPVQRSAAFLTGHAGKRILQLIAHYATNDVNNLDMFGDTDRMADQIVMRIAKTFAGALLSSHSVRNSIVKQMFVKVGAHAFRVDEVGPHSMTQAILDAAPEPVVISLSVDQKFRIGVNASDTFREVFLRKIPFMVFLV
jgi:hypothetical protein